MGELKLTVASIVDDVVKASTSGKGTAALPKEVGRRAILGLFAVSIGVDDDSSKVVTAALSRTARKLEVSEDAVAESMRKGSEALDVSAWEGYCQSLATTFLMSCDDPYQDAAEVLLWMVHACMNSEKREFVPYDARLRAGLRRVAERVQVPWPAVASFELAVLVADEHDRKAEENMILESVKAAKLAGETSWVRKASVTAAATVGAGLLAATGVLALPAIGSALTAVASATGAAAVGTAATAAGSGAGMIITGSTMGAAGAGLAGKKMYRRTEGVNQFEFVRLDSETPVSNAALTIGISGWITEKSDYTEPWSGLSDQIHEEVNCLQWEEKDLTALGKMLVNFLYNKATGAAMEVVVKQTILRGLLQAVAWPATVIEAANMIDNEWSVAMNKADAAGSLLADVLCKNVQGHRPVSLVGYNLGARVIFQALRKLNKLNRRDIVENVVLLGAPVTSDAEEWADIRRPVAGRLINVFADSDWVLYFIYRTSHLNLGVAGLHPIQLPGVENVDAVKSLGGSCNYRDSLKKILHGLRLYSGN
mmetsp:Transcript_2890/g.8835  ORF Transcript_2890/g.8835 Transcript_2890/m.8835 type:complete len:538 (+) Transcript_2890:49-1662(+)